MVERAQVEGRLANVSGAVLLGGESRRMGRDKAHVAFAGVPMATRIARLLDRFFEDLILVGGDPPNDAPGRHVPDTHGPRSSLRGLVSALEAARCDRVVVVATDMPLISADLIIGLTAYPEADAVVPRDAEHAHPLCAIYRREPVLEVARRLLDAERLRLSLVLDAVQTRYLEGQDLELLSSEAGALENANTPEELARLAQLRSYG